MAVAAEDYCRGSKLWCKPFRWKTIAVMTVAVMVVVADDCRGNALLGIVLVCTSGRFISARPGYKASGRIALLRIINSEDFPSARPGYNISDPTFREQSISSSRVVHTGRSGLYICRAIHQLVSLGSGSGCSAFYVSVRAVWLRTTQGS